MNATSSLSSESISVSKPIKQSISDSIYHYLYKKIAFLELEPGDRLSEAGLARQFGCSRIPVREAVQKLVNEGALEVFPQRGSFVTPISLTKLEHIRYIRETLERRVVLDDYDQGILQPVIPLLNSLVSRQKSLMAVNDYQQVFALDTDFHLLFYTIGHKEFVFEATGMLEINYMRARLLTLESEDKDNMIRQHSMIVTSIERNDRAALERSLNTHFKNVNAVIGTKEFRTRKGNDYFR
jgi:DNA-binding GntR family transcriptional regulator